VSVKEGIKAIKSLKIPIDILVNNAGMGHLALLAFTKISDIHNVFQVNYFSQMMVTQGLLGLLSKSKNGSIINIASIAGIDGEIGNSVYGATKASMILFTKVLSKEVANSNVRVNAIAPGLTETDFSIGMGEKATQFMEQKSLMHRLAKPDEVANVALFLASDDASFITGQVVRVDGGVY
jgi:Dehydrogenases with different specificities (related to short-chain alcohol dehydrogenases)